MIIFFHNFQDHLDSNNGRAISSDDELISLLEQMRAASPVITEFCGPNDFQIDIGIGENLVRSSTVELMVPRHI